MTKDILKSKKWDKLSKKIITILLIIVMIEIIGAIMLIIMLDNEPFIVPETPPETKRKVERAMKYHGITECYLMADGNYYFDRNGHRINLFVHKKIKNNKKKGEGRKWKT